MKPPYRVSIVHSVESGHFVHAHWWHFKYSSDFVHNTDTCETMLTLAEIKEGHYGGFLVLGWISFEDFGNELTVDVIKGEGYRWIILGGVTMLQEALVGSS